MTACAPVSIAATLAVNPTTGNLTVTTADSGANTIAASGGTNAAPYAITVDPGVVLSGDAVTQLGIGITKAGYTIHNSGSLAGALDGIRTTGVGVSAIIENVSGAVIEGSGVTAQGIDMNGKAGAAVVNAGTIRGQDDGIRVTGNIIAIDNQAGGLIEGIVGATSDGIQAAGNATITNAGTITGVANGIFGTTALSVTNTGTISGGTASGVAATSGSVSMSAGSISGVTGVLFTGATPDTLTLTGGTLTGTGGTAASLGNGNDSFNLSGSAVVNGNVSLGGNDDTALVSGGTLNGNLLLEGGNDIATFNAGTILGTLNAGIGDDLVTINGGVLTGPVIPPVPPSTTATQNAILLGAGADTLNINGGTITGAINGEADNDTINFASGTSVVGVVNGGTAGFDTLNFAGDALVQGSGFNAITNMEAINKTGTGTTTVNGATQTDAINLSDGNLFLNGNLSPATTGGTVAINQTGGHLGGVLSGATGTWLADLQITGGTFSPGSTLPSGGLSTSVGTLSLTSANFNGGTLLVHTNPSTPASDLLKVTGNLTLNNTAITITPLTKDAPVSTMTIVDVTGTTTGTWQQPVIIFEPGYTDSGLLTTGGTGVFVPTTFTIQAVAGTDDPDDLVIQVVHHYETLTGLSDFGAGFAEVLNGAVATASGDPALADFLGYLDYSDTADAAAAINALEPDGYLEAQLAAVNSTTLLHRVVENQNDAARSTRHFNRGWANYNFSDQGGTANYLTAGMGGGSMVDQTNFGALVSYMTMDDWYGRGSDLSTTTFGVYLGTGELVGWQWNGFAGYIMAEGGYDTLGDGSGNPPPASVSPEGKGWQFLLSGAYVMQTDRLSWGPTFGMEYVTLDYDAAEVARGGGLPSLEVDSDSLESLRMLLGVKFEYDLPGRTTPYLGVQYVSEFMGDLDGYSVSVNGGSFDVSQPVDLGDDAILIRAGVMHRFDQHWQVNAGYIGQLGLGSGSQDIHSFNLGAMANF